MQLHVLVRGVDPKTDLCLHFTFGRLQGGLAAAGGGGVISSLLLYYCCAPLPLVEKTQNKNTITIATYVKLLAYVYFWLVVLGMDGT